MELMELMSATPVAAAGPCKNVAGHDANTAPARPLLTDFAESRAEQERGSHVPVVCDSGGA